jgi:hypothetical protein
MFHLHCFHSLFLPANLVQKQGTETMEKTTWERTSVKTVLRNGSSGAYYGRWKIAGKQKGGNLWTDVSASQNRGCRMKRHISSACAASRAAVEAGKGAMRDLMQIYEEIRIVGSIHSIRQIECAPNEFRRAPKKRGARFDKQKTPS